MKCVVCCKTSKAFKIGKKVYKKDRNFIFFNFTPRVDKTKANFVSLK